MDFDLTDEQRLLKESVDRMIEDAYGDFEKRKLVWGFLRQGLIAAEPPCPSVPAKWTWPSWVGRRSEGSSPSGAMPRATSLYSVGSVEAGP